jgi:hypothetical protein
MPMVGKTKYPYTAAGIEAAKKASAKKGKPAAMKTWKLNGKKKK